MAQALHDVPQADLVAVASRSQSKADAFGDKWSVPSQYGSYATLVEDGNVDIVYIASPHSEHAKDMHLCLDAGKHVLCEKAFTLNAKQAEACITLARENRLFVMEAMWMRFFPAMAQVRTWLQQGILGDIRLVQTDFCFHLPFDPEHRLYNPDLGGGALLDLGIYPLSLTTMVLGLPDAIHSVAHIGHSGVDELDTITLYYERGATAVLSCSMRIYKPREAFIVGTEGFIKIHDLFFRPDTLTLALYDQEPLQLDVPFSGNGFPHEVEEVHTCLEAWAIESQVMPLDETLALMKIMDKLRATWGVSYPGEVESR
jgi:predicted dehydrogenase